MSLLEDPRLLQLLGEVDNAKTLIAQHGDPTGEVAQALDTLYRDLGAHLHDLVRTSVPPAPLITMETREDSVTDTRPHFESDGWYTDEVDGDALPLFTEGDLGEDTMETDVPEPDLETAPRPTPPADLDDVDIVSLAALQRDAADPEGELARLRVGREPPPWGAALGEMLDLLSPPDDLLAPSAMPEEASKVQWAAGVLEQKLGGLPPTVQLALLGLLGARALNLAAHLDVDVGPRLALDRLKRYRDNLDLAYVASLLPGPHPECDTWAEDAVAFWALLRPNA